MAKPYVVYVKNAFVLADGTTFLAPSQHRDVKRANSRVHVVLSATGGSIKHAYRVVVYSKRRAITDSPHKTCTKCLCVNYFAAHQCRLCGGSF